MSVTALTASPPQSRPHAVEKTAAVHTEEDHRLKQAAHRDDTGEPVRVAAPTQSSSVQSAIVSLKKGG